MKYLLPVILVAALSSRAAVVERIEIEGNSYVSDSLIVRALGLRIGDELNPVVIGTGIRSLYDLEYFQEVAVYSDSISPETVGVLVHILENPIVGEVIFENPGELDEDKARDSLMIFPGQTLSASRVAASEAIIRQLYAEKNRHMATVEARWGEPDSQGRQDITFVCDGGPDIRVGEIIFDGNLAFTDRELRGRMKTRQDSFWRSGKLKEDEFALDAGRIEDHYHQNGYPDARVLGSSREMSGGRPPSQDHHRRLRGLFQVVRPGQFFGRGFCTRLPSLPGQQDNRRRTLRHQRPRENPRERVHALSGQGIFLRCR